MLKLIKTTRKAIETFSGQPGNAKAMAEAIYKVGNLTASYMDGPSQDQPDNLLTLGVLCGGKKIGDIDEIDDLHECLDRNGHLADEIIVVTNQELNQDRTNEVFEKAEEFGARPVQISTNNFSVLRNAVIKRATSKWILMLDVDEDFIDRQQSFKTILSQTEQHILAYFVNIDSLVKVNGIAQPKEIKPYLRLFRTNPAFYYSGWVHEDILPSIMDYEGINQDQILTLDPNLFLIQHHGYKTEELRDHKNNRNILIMQEEIKTEPKPTAFLFLALHYFGENNLQQAQEYIRQGIIVCDDPVFVNLVHVKAQIFSLGALVSFQLGDLLKEKEYFQEAGYRAEQALTFAGFLKLPKWIIAQCYEYFKDYENAFKHYGILLQQKDFPTAEYVNIDYRQIEYAWNHYRQFYQK